MQKRASLLLLLVVMGTMVERAWCHGRMMLPIQRSSMWRHADRFPNSPANYNDHQLFCGGFQVQWEQNGGKCGTCGDPYHAPQPHDNEAGGKYATGVIVETYTQGQLIDVLITITANHLGYFMFKLCPNDDVNTKVTQECLDEHVLKTVDQNGNLNDKYYIGSFVGDKALKLQLPNDVTCTQCVLQWTYNTGNSWGCSSNDICCIGCGSQENFVNCADIAIQPSGGTVISNTPPSTVPTTTTITTNAPTTTSPNPTTTTTMMVTTRAATTMTTTTGNSGGQCRSAGLYFGVPGMDTWCQNNCAGGYCPTSHCICD